MRCLHSRAHKWLVVLALLLLRPIHTIVVFHFSLLNLLFLFDRLLCCSVWFVSANLNRHRLGKRLSRSFLFCSFFPCISCTITICFVIRSIFCSFKLIKRSIINSICAFQSLCCLLHRFVLRAKSSTIFKRQILCTISAIWLLSCIKRSISIIKRSIFILIFIFKRSILILIFIKRSIFLVIFAISFCANTPSIAF